MSEIEVNENLFATLGPRIIINGFPKAGTHQAYLMVAHLAKPVKPSHALGTFDDNSWGINITALDEAVARIRNQPEGTYLMGHVGYHPDIAQAMQDMGTVMLFVYRDFRDVAVSQVYHIESENTKFLLHPGREQFLALPNHEARLIAVIDGLGKYSGIFERWKLYAPWLGKEGVFQVRYEDMQWFPKKLADKAISYIISYTARNKGFLPFVTKAHFLEAVDKAVTQLAMTEYSLTYRKGKIGGWMNEFTPDVKQVFKEHAGNWLVQLYYEFDNNW